MTDRDLLFRRRALEIITQLPESPADARIVLAYVRQLLDEWVDQPSSKVVSGSSPSRIHMPFDKSPSLPS